MSEKILYSYTGLFDNPDAIINAAEKAEEKGYKKYDIHSPYPVHGMPKAMKLPASKLGYVALVLGLTGTLSAIALTYWVSAIEYPIVIGGKPLFSFPAYVPIIFELTVLFAAIGTVLAMLFVFFKFPNNSHPLQGTEFMKKVSSDMHGISIQAEDENFNEEDVKQFLQSLGAINISPVYYDNEEINHKHKIFEPKFILFLIIVAAVNSGAIYFIYNKVLYMPPFDWMVNQEKLNPQKSYEAVFADGFGMRLPVEGTVARGYLPYPYKNQPDAAGELLVNPIPVSKKSLTLGQKRYDTFCSPCHGYHGEGDSRLRGQFPNPPSIHSEKVRNWSDGRIYHVITDGQNIMPGYNSQLEPEERWAVVNYIRVLQRSLNAKESDLQ